MAAVFETDGLASKLAANPPGSMMQVLLGLTVCAMFSVELMVMVLGLAGSSGGFC